MDLNKTTFGKKLLWSIGGALLLGALALMQPIKDKLYGGVVATSGTAQASPFIVTTDPNYTLSSATTSQFIGSILPTANHSFDIGATSSVWRVGYFDSVITGSCTGCGGGGGGTGLQLNNSMVTGQIIFALNTSTGATLSGFTLATSTSAFYLPSSYTLFATNTVMVNGTSTGVFAMQNATATSANIFNLSIANGTSTGSLAWQTASGTLANIFNLNVSGTLDTASTTNLTCGGQNCRRTLAISAGGCNAPGSAAGVTSTLDFFGPLVYRNTYFQPLAFNTCVSDWIPPDSWDGNSLNCIFEYGVTTTDANGVTWGIQAQGLNSGSAWNTAFSAATATVTTVATTTNALTVTTSTALTVGGVTADPAKVVFRISRSNTGASTNTASFNGAKCEYGINRLTDL